LPSQHTHGDLYKDKDAEKANESPPKTKQTGGSSNKSRKQRAKAQREKTAIVIQPAIPSLKNFGSIEQSTSPTKLSDKSTTSKTSTVPAESKPIDTSIPEATPHNHTNIPAGDHTATTSIDLLTPQNVTATTIGDLIEGETKAKLEVVNKPLKTNHLATIKEVAEDDPVKTSVEERQVEKKYPPLKEHKKSKGLTDVQIVSKHDLHSSPVHNNMLIERDINSIEHKVPGPSETNAADPFSYQLTPPYYGSSGPAFSQQFSPRHVRRSPGTAYNNMAQYPTPAPFAPMGGHGHVLPVQNYAMAQPYLPAHMGANYPPMQFGGEFNGQVELYNHFPAPPDAHYTYQQPVYGYNTNKICPPYQPAPFQSQGQSFSNMIVDNSHVPGKKFVHNDGTPNMRRGKKENYRPRYIPKMKNGNGGEIVPAANPSLHQVRPLGDNAIMMHGFPTQHTVQNTKNGP